MKKLSQLKKTSLIIGLSLFTFFANAKSKTGNEILETEKIIKESIIFSTPVSNQKVEILFSTNTNGEVNFVFAKTENSKLKTEIEKQFSHLHLSKLKTYVIHSIILNFKTI